MNKKEICDCCQKKEIEVGNKGVYLGEYQGDKNADKIHICFDCYDNKEQWYLENYVHIYSYSVKQMREKNTGYVKNEDMDCCAGKKGSDGKILRQGFCSHCNPWKFKNEDKDKNVNSDIDGKSKQNVSDRSTNRWPWILGIVGIVIILALIILQLRRKINCKK